DARDPDGPRLVGEAGVDRELTVERAEHAAIRQLPANAAPRIEARIIAHNILLVWKIEHSPMRDAAHARAEHLEGVKERLCARHGAKSEKLDHGGARRLLG